MKGRLEKMVGVVLKVVLFVIITITMHMNVSVSRPINGSLEKVYVPPSAPNPTEP
jgi:hypothetical protein